MQFLVLVRATIVVIAETALFGVALGSDAITARTAGGEIEERETFVVSLLPSLANGADSDGCRTPILISVGQRSNFSRTPFRFISDSVPG